MRRLTLTMALFIMIIVMVWFFGVTLFQSSLAPRANESQSFMGQVIGAWSYEARIREVIIDHEPVTDRLRAQTRCEQVRVQHVGEIVECFWGGVAF